VNDRFRGLSLSRNPNLWQSLPAEKQHEFESSPEIFALKDELAALKGKKDAASTARQRALYPQRRTLIAQELRKWQKLQPYRVESSEAEKTHLMAYHRTIFRRTRFLTPERDRLASSLLEVVPLRSPTGLAVLRDMVALCQKETEVIIRPGLEPEKCRCSKIEGQKPSGFVYF